MGLTKKLKISLDKTSSVSIDKAQNITSIKNFEKESEESYDNTDEDKNQKTKVVEDKKSDSECEETDTKEKFEYTLNMDRINYHPEFDENAFDCLKSSSSSDSTSDKQKSISIE